jgi:signal transduction histidine kinase
MSIHDGVKNQITRLKPIFHAPFFALGSYHGLNVPSWRRPLIGYISMLPLSLIVFLVFIVGWFGNISIPPTYLNTILLLLVTIVAYFWGVGPSLVMLILGTLLIIDLFLRPLAFGKLFHQIFIQVVDVYDVISVVLFLITGVIISMIVFQREKEHIKAHENEQAFCSSQQQLEEFISVVSHELKTPLTGIQGNIQLAKRKLQKHILPHTDDQHIRQSIVSVMETLQQAEKSAHMQTRLVNDLLDASRMQRNEFRVIRVECNLVDIIGNVVERYRQSIATRIITLECSQHAVIICGDPDRIDQVLSNYITNALKYSPMDKPISVRLSLDDEWARVSVRDEGAGLASEEQQRIWERFYRARNVDAQTDSGVPHVGLGIGLALCKAIVEQHNGQVGVESAPGHGSTFWFTLPLHSENSQGKC